MQKRKLKLLTVICPIVNEEDNIEPFYQSISKTLGQNNINFELIFVNDGSRDNSLMLLYKFLLDDKRVKIINFSRNFGQQSGISAGLEYASGVATVIIDVDLQDPPELIIELVNKWRQGFDVVNAKRKTRHDGFFKDLTAILFYKILNLLLTTKIPENVGEFRLLDAKAVSVLRKLPEKDRYLRGLANWIGFKQNYVEFDRKERYAGKTKYSYRMMIGLALNAIFSFSRLPMRIATYSGLLLICVAIFIIIYVIFSNLNRQVVPGWTSEILIFSIFSAIELLALGIISEYVGRIYNQIQDRPLYIISDTTNFDKISKKG